jgi:hypothetical protein
MTGKGFRFGSRTEEVNRKVMRERENDYASPERSSVNSGFSADAGILINTGKEFYGWRPGEKPILVRRIMSKSLSDQYGPMVVCNGKLYYTTRKDIGDGIATVVKNFFDENDIIFDDSNSSPKIVNSLQSDGLTVIASMNNKVNYTVTMETLFKNNSTIVDCIYYDNEKGLLYTAGANGISVKNLNKHRVGLYTLSDNEKVSIGPEKVHPITSMDVGSVIGCKIDCKKITDVHGYEILISNGIDIFRAPYPTYVGRRDSDITGFCSLNGEIFDCGGYGICKTFGDENNFLQQSSLTHIHDILHPNDLGNNYPTHMISVPEEILNRLLDVEVVDYE